MKTLHGTQYITISVILKQPKKTQIKCFIQIKKAEKRWLKIKNAKDIITNEIVLVKFKGSEYQKDIENIIPILAKEKYRICYITFNKTVNSLVESFSKGKIDTDKLVFIDAITRNIGFGKPVKGCHYLDKPSEFEKLSIIVNNILELDSADYFIFDNISTLLIYSDDKSIIKFVHNFVEMIRASHKKTFLALISDEKSKSIEGELEVFVDKTTVF